MAMIDGINAQIQSVPSSVDVKPMTAAKDKGIESQQVSADKVEAVALDNVVAESKDGDTLQENEESVKALSEGIVLKKIQPEDEESAAKILQEQNKEDAQKKVVADKEAEERTQEKVDTKKETDERVNSLIGMTKFQVEQLYREGRISKNQYDENMESREKLTAEAASDPAVKEMTQMAEEGKKATQIIEEIFNAAEHDRADLAAQIYK